MIQQTIRDNLESEVGDKLSRDVGKTNGVNFTFDAFNLSQVHVKIDTLKVVSEDGQEPSGGGGGHFNSSIKGDVKVGLHGPANVAFKLKYFTTPFTMT